MSDDDNVVHIAPQDPNAEAPLPADVESNVVIGPFITRHAIPVDRVLTEALKADLEGVVIVGQEKDGGEFYFASSIPDGPNVLWLLADAQRRLLEVRVGEDDDDDPSGASA